MTSPYKTNSLTNILIEAYTPQKPSTDNQAPEIKDLKSNLSNYISVSKRNQLESDFDLGEAPKKSHVFTGQYK